jgi:hypothetical protein
VCCLGHAARRPRRVGGCLCHEVSGQRLPKPLDSRIFGVNAFLAAVFETAANRPQHAARPMAVQPWPRISRRAEPQPTSHQPQPIRHKGAPSWPPSDPNCPGLWNLAGARQRRARPEAPPLWRPSTLAFPAAITIRYVLLRDSRYLVQFASRRLRAATFHRKCQPGGHDRIGWRCVYRGPKPGYAPDPHGSARQDLLQSQTRSARVRQSI